MAPQSRLVRHALGAAAVLIVSLTAVYTARGLYKPIVPDAPVYRQKGSTDAKVVIVEFSDFQCPACAAALPPLKGILAAYKGDIRVIFKHFPLEHIHTLAREAARAAECAGRQGRFWEMHDLLFESQGEWSEAAKSDWTQSRARLLNLDEIAFAQCLKDPSVDAAVTTDAADGDTLWVGSTPTFFINGRRFVGARQLSTRGSLWIEKQLKK